MFKDYFYVFEVKELSSKVVANEGVTKEIRKQIRKKLKKVRYFEAEEVDGVLHMVIGTSRIETKVRMKVFFLELYASLKNSNIVPTFKAKEQIIGDSKVKIYTIPKFGWNKLK
jgi:predicted phage-related endonuclease